MFTILGADGKEYGPVSAAKISEWIAGGRANQQTKVRRTNETEWRTLADFPELGGAPAPAPGEPPVAMPASSGSGAAPLGLELASRWLRLGAQLLDGITSMLFLGPGIVLLAMAGVIAKPDNPNPALIVAGFLTTGLAFALLLAIQIYLLVTRGQTIGKKLLGIKIVGFADDANPGFVKVILLRIFVNGLIGMVPIVGFFYSLVDIVFIFREDQRCLHDLIAGTKVVKA